MLHIAVNASVVTHGGGQGRASKPQRASAQSQFQLVAPRQCEQLTITTITTKPMQICWFWLRSVKKAWQTTRQLPPHIDIALLVAHILGNGYNKEPQATHQLPPHIEIAPLFAHNLDNGYNKVSQNTQQLPPHIAIALLFTHILAMGSWVVASFYSIRFKK